MKLPWEKNTGQYSQLLHKKIIAHDPDTKM